MTMDLSVYENAIIEGANETKAIPVPEGTYEATVDKIRLKALDIKNGSRAGETVPVVEVIWHIHNQPALEEEMGRDKITVRQDIWLDVEGGAIAMGKNKNLSLGRLREAVGLNDPSKPFQLSMLEGRGPCKIAVVFGKPNAAGDRFNQVDRVEAM